MTSISNVLSPSPSGSCASPSRTYVRLPIQLARVIARSRSATRGSTRSFNGRAELLGPCQFSANRGDAVGNTALSEGGGLHASADVQIRHTTIAVVTARQSGSRTFTAAVTAAEGDATPGDNSATETTTVNGTGPGGGGNAGGGGGGGGGAVDALLLALLVAAACGVAMRRARRFREANERFQMTRQ